MLNTNIESNINSIPYLLYMSEQEQKEKDSGNEKQNTIWREDSPPLTHNRDWKIIYPRLYPHYPRKSLLYIGNLFLFCPILLKNFGYFKKTAYSRFLYTYEQQ